MNKKLILLGFVFILLSSFVYAETFNIIDDTYTAQNLPNDNYESSTIGAVSSRDGSRNLRNYWYIDLLNISNDATFHYRTTSVSGLIAAVSVDFYFCNDTLPTSTLTWNNQATLITNCDGSPFYSQAMDTYSATTDYTINISSLTSVQKNFTIRAITNPESYDGSARFIFFDSAESVTQAFRPYVQYTFKGAIFELTSNNLFNNSLIDVFNVTFSNSTNITTVQTNNGSVFWDQDQIVNITAVYPDYFTQTFINYDTSKDLIIDTWQSELIVNATDESDNLLIFNATVNGQFNESNATNQTRFLVNSGSVMINGKAKGFNFNSSNTLTLNNKETAFSTLLFGENQVNLTVREFFSNNIVNNYNATFTRSGLSQTISTNNGRVEFLGALGTYTIDIEPENFANTTETFDLVNESQNLTIFVFDRNSIFVQVFDEKTFDIIDFTNLSYTIQNSDLGFFQQGTTNNGTVFFEGLNSGTYKISMEKQDLYSQREVFVTLGIDEHKSVNMFLINTTFAANTLPRVIDEFAAVVENATLTVQQNLLGNIVTVAQKVTDSTGTAQFFLALGDTYFITIEHPNFDTRLATITPVFSPYTVDLRINPDLTYNYTLPFDNVAFNYAPRDTNLARGVQNFNLSIISDIGVLNYFGVNIYGFNLTNITTSPTGGVAIATANLTNAGNTLKVGYFFKATGEPLYELNITYNLGQNFTNQTITQGLEDLKDDFSLLARIIIITFIIVVLLFVANELGASRDVHGMILIGVLVLFSLVGWIPLIGGVTLITLIISSLIIIALISRGDGLSG